jgi:hypothetical protein
MDLAGLKARLQTLRGAMKAIGGAAWESPQTAIGLAKGYSEGGKLGRVGMDNGQLSLTMAMPEGSLPRQSGQTLLAPPTMSPVDKAHEAVHGEQSRRYGPGYIPMNILGAKLSALQSKGDEDINHPFEDEAYYRTEPTEGLSQRLQFKAALRRP